MNVTETKCVQGCMLATMTARLDTVMIQRDRAMRERDEYRDGLAAVKAYGDTLKKVMIELADKMGVELPDFKT